MLGSPLFLANKMRKTNKNFWRLTNNVYFCNVFRKECNDFIGSYITESPPRR